MANHFDGPPGLAGTEQQQLEAMYRYLQTMSDALNQAMNSITLANFAQEAQEQIRHAIDGQDVQKEINNTKTSLRSMIIKSAEIVTHEMEELSTRLTEQYSAVSDRFGELDRQLSQSILANAEGIRQNFEYLEQLTGRADGMDSYIIRSSQYIFSGLIGYDALSMPIYGIAIGENITQYDANGNPYLNDNAKVATFTKDRLSFWQGTTEMAYFSNRKMYITDVEILKRMTMGNYTWQIQADGSMGLTVSDQQTAALLMTRTALRTAQR